MSFELWGSFFAVACVAVLSPGPAVLLAVTHGGLHGVRGALFPVLGNVTGLALITLASSIGVGSILEASSQWLTVLRIAGGLYLAYMGVKLLLSKPQSFSLNAQDGHIDVHAFSPKRAYLQGIGVALSNPKALLFIGALFPQFVDAGLPVWPQLTIMAATLMTLSFTALMTYAALSGRLVARGRRALYGKINKIAGALFVVFGIGLAAGSR